MKRNEALDLVVIDRNTPVPLHYQFEQCIRLAVENGRLKPGERLPSILDFAESSGLSPATVAQAFAELAREGVLESSRGHGTRVAEIKPVTTEVVIHARFTTLPPAKGTFFYQIVEGLRKGYGDPHRRFTFTHYDDPAPSGRELLQVCRARMSDGVVAYRPLGDIADAVNFISTGIPTVTLFYQVDKSSADCVVADPANSLRELLREQIARGIRKFVYVGRNHLIEEGRAFSPYLMMLEEFRGFMAKAGIAPDIRIAKQDHYRQERAESLRMAADVSDDAAVILASPDILLDPNAALKSDRLITYTESAESLEAIMGKANILYMGLEAFGREASALLKERLKFPAAPTRTVSVPPEIYRVA